MNLMLFVEYTSFIYSLFLFTILVFLFLPPFSLQPLHFPLNFLSFFLLFLPFPPTSPKPFINVSPSFSVWQPEIISSTNRLIRNTFPHISIFQHLKIKERFVSLKFAVFPSAVLVNVFQMWNSDSYRSSIFSIRNCYR